MPSEPEPRILLPHGAGPHPGVVLGAEAYGVNSFILGTRRRLAGLGFAGVVPDYYHGDGPRDPEAYADFTEVKEHIGHLDFAQGARDLAGAVDTLRAAPAVDAGRVCLWGYCTGATLAWLAAGMRGDLAAAVLFFPSQPVFGEHGPGTPADPMDLLWQLTCPALFLYGANDGVMPPARLAELRDRIGRWGVDADVRVYPGAGHAFTAPWGPFRHDEAATAAWDDAVAFLKKHTRPRDGR